MNPWPPALISKASLTDSVPYLGASAFTFSMNAACPLSFGSGECVVRVPTGTPGTYEKVLCPAAGEQIDVELPRFQRATFSPLNLFPTIRNL